MKCQGENGFTGDAFALTSASGILLKPDKAWPDRGPASRPAGGQRRRRLGWGRRGGPLPDFGAGEFAADLLQEKRAGASLHSRPLPGESCSLAELTQISERSPSGVASILLSSQVRGEAGAGRGWQRGLYLAETLEVTGQHPAELAGSLVAARLGTAGHPGRLKLAFVYSLF